MDEKKLFRTGAICAFGLAAALVVNGIATFTGPSGLWLGSRLLVPLFAFGFLPALQVKVGKAHAGYAFWMTNLAYLGAAAEALYYFGKVDMNTTWLLFGGLGLASLAFNIIALRHALWPKALAWIGVATGVLLLGVVAASFWPAALNIVGQVSAGLGAVVLYPVWLVWLGIRLRAE
jgi:hypothetical protein